MAALNPQYIRSSGRAAEHNIVALRYKQAIQLEDMYDRLVREGIESSNDWVYQRTAVGLDYICYLRECARAKVATQLAAVQGNPLAYTDNLELALRESAQMDAAFRTLREWSAVILARGHCRIHEHREAQVKRLHRMRPRLAPPKRD